ncbi:DUF5784 family protein [Salarchaeum sp. III]|uniref:DUF5784 family protein n=1 Tax=Salarchaeum sp. III TaxID=3107927 RepID=UPI002ED9F497
MARPLRFRYSGEAWSDQRVRRDILEPLDDNIGATERDPRFDPPPEFRARRFEMANGDLALFAWRADGPGGYWLGNTETPSALWRTDKRDFEDAPYAISRWAQREFLDTLLEAEPWLAPYRYLAWFFLPVLCSKDGRETTRAFFREHAAGFPDADRDDALSFYDDFLKTGVFQDERHEMAAKLGTSAEFDLVRMSATMSEFNVAYVLTEAGYDLTPEIEVSTGHSLDFRADDPAGNGVLVEVTRPNPPSRRVADSPIAAVKETVDTKTRGQLQAHGGGAVLFVDCSSFRDDDWQRVLGERPDVGHRPAVVFRLRPDGSLSGYAKGRVPLDVDFVLESATS